MLCKHFMVRSESALSKVSDTATLGQVLAHMVKHRRQHLLVTDDKGHYVGEMTSSTLAKMLLPDETAAPQTREQAELETINDVDDRIMPHLGRHVRDFVTRETPLMQPDSPLSDALRLLSRGALRLPVVDPATNKLVGVISALTILRRYQF
jgi:CBS domain-containing protein